MKKIFGGFTFFLTASMALGLVSCGQNPKRDLTNSNSYLNRYLNGGFLNGNNGNLNINYQSSPCPNNGLRFNLWGNLNDNGTISSYTAPSVTGKSSVYANPQTLNRVEIQGVDNGRLIVKANVCLDVASGTKCMLLNLKLTSSSSNNDTFTGDLGLLCCYGNCETANSTSRKNIALN